ncbi:uncharacterized protein LOC107427461 [Ziziphus jujuba]|uniref:Uncharacterized protein LOC107427461 n=1 Tax=Ziziphus jujuba TaxID=326968 RepID=A0A6P4AAN2_ZIZJJ|nr:uncharacterized protein LOC107427461 [Ziziphus jujuba]
MAEPAPRVSNQMVQKAVNALLKWRNSKAQTKKPQLIDNDDEFVYLILTLKKIPSKDRINAYKIPLPHSLHSQFSDLCLIVDDRPKSGLTKDDAAKKIKSEDIPISKILKFSKLKSDYRPFEAKRKLCDSYDMFLADKRVIPLLPRLLGKHFFKKRKIPVPVDLKHKNWKEQVEKVRGSALLYLRTGTCCVVRVAKVSMDMEEIIENVVAAINGVVEVVPRKWGNVRSLHLKLLESLALPIYQAVPDLKLKIEGIKEEEEEKEKNVKEEETKSADEDDEKVGKKKKKGRIHAVRYMDVNVGGDELGSDGDWNAGEEGDDSENDEINADEKVEKKRKRNKRNAMSDGGVLAELNGKKQLKSVKLKDKDGLSAKGKKENSIKKETDDSSKKVKKIIKGTESDRKKEKKESLVGKLKAKKSK